MKLFSHFAVLEFSNTYLIGPDEGGDAIIIDPGVFDVPLLKLIETNKYYIRSVLVTHAHRSHINGLNTLLKVYKAETYSRNQRIQDVDCKRIHAGDKLKLSGFEVEAIEIPGHTSDSLVYKCGKLLFTGDVLQAGTIGSTSNSYAKALLVSAIQEKLFSMDGNMIILPGHGPPSTIELEKLMNPALKTSF